jgi:hypothetical protein
VPKEQAMPYLRQQRCDLVEVLAGPTQKVDVSSGARCCYEVEIEDANAECIVGRPLRVGARVGVASALRGGWG